MRIHARESGKRRTPPCRARPGLQDCAASGADTGRKGEDTMQDHGLKISEFVTCSDLEVLNRGSDFETAVLTITDVNRPGLQFHSFYDYFDPRRLQVLGKAEITYLK